MTEKELRQKYVNTMIGWIGLDRAKGTHKPIIDIYNNHKPLARGYKVTYSDEYCATTVSAAAVVCGLTDIIPTECGCGQQIEAFRKLKRWVENDTYTPRIGDVIYYDWNDTGVGDCTGWPEHVGVVEEISGTTLTIVEGNMSGKVGRRTIKTNARYIRGYGIPDFASKVSKTTDGSTQSTKKSLEEIAKEVIVGKWGNGDERKKKLTDAGYDYNAIQSIINQNGSKTYDVKVTAANLNIRKGAGTQHTVVGVIRDRGRYTIVEESTGTGATKGWGKLKNGAGWISLDHVTKV